MLECQRVKYPVLRPARRNSCWHRRPKMGIRVTVELHPHRMSRRIPVTVGRSFASQRYTQLISHCHVSLVYAEISQVDASLNVICALHKSANSFKRYRGIKSVGIHGAHWKTNMHTQNMQQLKFVRAYK